ncbi:MAG: invasion associated locus B family protein [Rhodobacteraceae bacterium]|nr:invasion associated locus B family protein [Paracoccaceae bacterium]
MIRTLRIIAAGLVMSLGIAVAAQESQNSAGQEGTTADATDLQVGEIVVQPTRTDVGDWTIVCVRNDEGNEECRMQQLVLNDSNTPIATFEIWKIDNSTDLAAGSVIALPLGVMLEEGILMQVDQALPRRYRYVMCDGDGCYSRLGLSKGEIGRMKAGNSMTMTIFAFQSPDQPIDLEISLAGFTKAFESL